jgi:hypothetical protein
MFLPRSLALSKKDLPNITIDETNFNFLQNVIREVFCLSS